MKNSSVKHLFLLIISLAVYAAEDDTELEALKVQAKELSQRIEAYETKKDTDQASMLKEKKEEANSDYIVDDAAGNNPPMKQNGV